MHEGGAAIELPSLAPGHGDDRCQEADGLAHDLRNALTLAQLALERERAHSGLALSALAQALAEARTICVGHLERRRGGGSWREVALRELLLSELERVGELSGGSVPIVLRCPPGLSIWTEPVVLARAVGNLALNALRASESDAPVRVRARKLGPWIALQVTDRGRGMDTHELARAMEAGRSTRPGGGYGSASLLACTRTLGARLTIRSRSGWGTTGRILLARDGRARVWRLDPLRPPPIPLAHLGERRFSALQSLAEALRAGRPEEVRACRVLPRREVAGLEALCLEQRLPLRIDGLRSGGWMPGIHPPEAGPLTT